MAQSFKSKDGLFAAVDCSSWHDFRVKLSLTLNGGPSSDIYEKYLFRGQACSQWSLIAAFDRTAKELSPLQAERKYDGTISKFREGYLTYGRQDGSLEYLPKVKEHDDTTEFEMLAQHYGVPTRLLDFSYSPYIAAFFSFSKPHECESTLTSIWALSADVTKVFVDSHVKIESEFYAGNRRRLNQLGVFIRNNTETRNLEAVFSSEGAGKYYRADMVDHPPLLYRFDLPISEHKTALNDLNLMRINSMSVFPGIEGVVGWINKSLI